FDAIPSMTDFRAITMPTTLDCNATREFALTSKKASQLRVFVSTHGPQGLSLISFLRIVKRVYVKFAKRDSPHR
ncbi:MAG: hypothetical protein ACXW6K_11415, partial [Candidatus Binatia bacterium]